MGLGTDIVSVPRIRKLVQASPTFLERWFTAAEIDYCMAKAEPSQHLAARVAGKEAVIKALEWDWDGPVVWRCIEIVPGAKGVPQVRLSGRVLAAAQERGIRRVRVSLSHCDEFATAVALVDVDADGG